MGRGSCSIMILIWPRRFLKEGRFWGACCQQRVIIDVRNTTFESLLDSVVTDGRSSAIK